MAYYLKIKNEKVHLYNTKTNGELAVFSKNVKDVDIQGDEIVVYLQSGKIEIYKVEKGSIKGPIQVR